MKKAITKICVLMLIMGLNWAGLSAIGETIAYFSDTENSSANLLRIGTLDMTIRSGQNNFTPNAENMMPGDQVNRDIYVGKTASSLPLKHRVSYEFVNGNSDLCDQLDLKIWYDHYHGPVSEGYTNRDMRLKYNDSLTSLNNLIDPDFIIPHPDDRFDTDNSDGTEQWFFYSIIVPNDLNDSFQGEVCEFKFVYEAWQDNFDNYGDGGFTDKEEIKSTIKVGYNNPPVVLNEFLPNAENYPEFVEIYNKTGVPIDLQGYKVKAGNRPIPVNPATTSRFSGGNTVIPAYGWLVVAPPAANYPNIPGGWNDILNNSGGTIDLYNASNIKLDSYTYGAPDHNVNNTPGWTNNLVGYWPFDGNLEDQSGNDNNGTNHGTTFVAGKINEGLSFDGIDDYVTIANSDDFDFGSGEFTIEFWIKTDSDSRQWVGTRYENYGPGWGLGTQNSHTLGYIRTLESGTTKTEVEGSVDVGNNNWHHLVMVRTGDKIKLYTDGNFEKEGTLAGNVNNDESIEIGRISWSSGSQYFSGLIDEVKIYNRALDSSEISEHYSDSTSSGTVPVDKSYARIPDGSSNWVDPFPTPGFSNLSSNENPEEIEWETQQSSNGGIGDNNSESEDQSQDSEGGNEEKSESGETEENITEEINISGEVVNKSESFEDIEESKDNSEKEEGETENESNEENVNENNEEEGQEEENNESNQTSEEDNNEEDNNTETENNNENNENTDSEESENNDEQETKDDEEQGSEDTFENINNLVEDTTEELINNNEEENSKEGENDAETKDTTNQENPEEGNSGEDEQQPAPEPEETETEDNSNNPSDDENSEEESNQESSESDSGVNSNEQQEENE